MLFADLGGLYADDHGFTRTQLLSSLPDLTVSMFLLEGNFNNDVERNSLQIIAY
jgi:hypothetical protein